MSGAIKELRHPSSSKRIDQVSSLEWFRCTFGPKSYAAMIVGERAVKGTMVLLADDKGDIIVRSFESLLRDGEFLGYLTTEDNVTIYGSLDPNWVEPDPKEPGYLKVPDDPLDLNQVLIGVPFYFNWDGHTEGCVGLKLRAVDTKNDGEWILLRFWRGKYARSMGGHTTQNGHIRQMRRFIEYAPHELEHFKNHGDRHEGIWEEEAWPI